MLHIRKIYPEGPVCHTDDWVAVEETHKYICTICNRVARDAMVTIVVIADRCKVTDELRQLMRYSLRAVHLPYVLAAEKYAAFANANNQPVSIMGGSGYGQTTVPVRALSNMDVWCRSVTSDFGPNIKCQCMDRYADRKL